MQTRFVWIHFFASFAEKLDTMKITSFLPCIILIWMSVAGCELLDSAFYTKSRAGCSRDGKADDSGAGHDDSAPAYDTTVFFSAVRYGEDYDWQRDTAYGATDYEVLLYRDFTPVLTISSKDSRCISPEPDMHHIIDGHLYTGKTTSSQTIIGVDGEELFRFDGREFLKGLIIKGSTVYTLTQKCSGSGFSYRKNGEVIISSLDGKIFGSFNEPSYGPSGALYLDGDELCFCYSTVSRGVKSFYTVRDGATAPVELYSPGSQIFDLKIIHSDAMALTNNLSGLVIEDGRLWTEPTLYSITGKIRKETEMTTYSGIINALNIRHAIKICDEEAVIYHQGKETFAVGGDSEGYVLIHSLGSGAAGTVRSAEPCKFLSPSCAALCGSKMVVALSPRDRSKGPVIMTGGESKEVQINGYVSCVSMTVSPAG